MDRKTIMRRCRSFPGVTEEQPWGPEENVYKVGGKGFVFMGLTGEPPSITLKMDPRDVEPLRALYPGTVTVPAYLTRGGWNSVTVDGTVPDDELIAWIRRSYEIVAAGLTRKARADLGIELPLRARS
jgi:predicted DNA-binding protein (MmcQ/YjbR family)